MASDIGRAESPPLPIFVLAGPVLPLAVAVFVLSLAGCAADSGASPSFTVTDSAGIEIVHSTRPVWTAETAWRVQPVPRLEIGRMSGPDPYLLDRVMGVTVLHDGVVVIAHRGDNTIRFYDADGTFVRQVGGQGGGPQEFRQLMGLVRHGDEIWGRQFGGEPTKVFDRTGTFLRPVTTEVPAGMRGIGVHGVFEDGSLLLGDWPQAQVATPEPRVATATLVRQAGDRLDTVGVVPAVRMLPFPGRPNGLYQEFSPRLTVAVAGDRFLHAFPEDYQITVRDTAGAVRRIIRRDWDPAPVTDTHIAEYTESILDLGAESGGEVSPRLQEHRQTLVDAQVHPEHHPAFERLVVARTGHIWTERPDPDHPKTLAGSHQVRDTPTTWDVFDPDGVWLGSVELPSRFLAYEFGDDYVAGLWKNEMDVDFVRVYGLSKGEE